MRIFIIGQCTLHWGRMEFGNIGNYYIMEPFVRELHKVFPDAKIKTTFQLSDRFCKDEKITVIPMDYYYGFNNSDIDIAEKEYHIALQYSKTTEISERTPYINEVINSDLVIDFSGDIWGDNADFLGENRFLVGLYKDRIAQLMGKKTVMIAGSPGPFSNEKNLEFAKEVFENFDLVTNREALSREVLIEHQFNVSKLVDLSCPAFLFEPRKELDITTIDPNFTKEQSIVGVILCGWNFLNGPFDLWPRDDHDYQFIIDPLIDFLNNNIDVKLCLMSHSNGFIPEQEPFKLIHGRDYPITKQLETILIKRGYNDRIFTLNGIYDAWTTKAIISQFDMLISGRVHAAVAGMSQLIPTVIIDYGHEPKAHKLKGFANEAGMLKMVAEPQEANDIMTKMKNCWENRNQIKTELSENIPKVQTKAHRNFQLLKALF